MANRKVKSTKAKIAESDRKDYQEGLNASSLSANPLDQLNKYKKNKFIYLAIIIIVLALLISYKKSWFVAAVVNGAPISNFEVLKEEDSQFRKQVIDQLVNKKLILDEANKKGVKVNEKDVDAKIAEIEQQVGGATALDSLLTQQGQTRASVRDQIKITLALEKMFGPEIAITPDEVAKFIEENKNQMQSTTSAELEKEATEILKSQKQNQIFSQKFQEIKKAANIQIF